MTLPQTINRRCFLEAGAATAGLLLLPEIASAATYVDPYSGSIPLVFPVATGAYQAPVANNWHESREGKQYTWNHRDTGNAAGTPQLHVEVHYPKGKTFTCTHCAPRKSGLTSLDPFNSLAGASPRA